MAHTKHRIIPDIYSTLSTKTTLNNNRLHSLWHFSARMQKAICMSSKEHSHSYLLYNINNIDIYIYEHSHQPCTHLTPTSSHKI